MSEYPLPPFVMLEITKFDFNKGIQIALVDKKHNCILDYEKKDNTSYQSCVDNFKQDLLDNGVI